MALLALGLACIGSLVIIFLFLKQLHRLREGDYVQEQLVPLCKTLASLLDACDEYPKALTAVMDSLERSSPFRNTWITIYDSSGDVWADSHVFTNGRKPVTASTMQREAYLIAKDAHATANAPLKLRRGVRHCALSGSTETVALAAATTSSGLLVVVQSCCGGSSD